MLLFAYAGFLIGTLCCAISPAFEFLLISRIVAGLFGGVSQTTPYIGHPAYKAMGGRAAYTLATGLVVGLGGIFGYLAFVADALPKPVLAPILVFIGLEITGQSYLSPPRRHAAAVTLAVMPSVA